MVHRFISALAGSRRLIVRSLVVVLLLAVSLVFEALVKGYLHMYRPGDAVHFLNLWLEREPDNVLALYWQGHLFDEAENRQGALASFGRIIEIDADYDDARYRYADMLLTL